MMPSNSVLGRRGVGVALVAPALVVFVLFAFLPFLHSVYLSFFRWNGISSPVPVGIDNYVRILTDPGTSVAFLHALVLILFYGGVTTAIGFTLACLMGSARIRGMKVFRTLLFLPYVIAPAAVGVVWRWLLSPEGPFNTLLRAVGLGGLARPWLGDFDWALPSVGVIGTWMLYGVVMVLLLAGVQRIPLELYEAGRLDGAGPVRLAWAITMPSLRAELAVVLVLTTTTALRNFDLIYVTTRGGPGTSTVVPSWLVYREAFVAGNVGSAGAMAVILTLVVGILCAVLLPLARERNG